MSFRRLLIVVLTVVVLLLMAARIRAESPFEETGYGSKDYFLNVTRLQTGAGARQRADLTAFLPPVGNQGKQQRDYSERQEGQCRVERQQNDEHAAEQDYGGKNRQCAVHDHRLDGEAVGRYAIQ